MSIKNTSPSDVDTLLAERLGLKIDIHGIDEPVIYEYFIKLNNGDFVATAGLFAEQGYLDPPFDNQIQGREAIAQYLETEANGIIFLPQAGKISIGNFNHTQYQIHGKVEMNWFTVNVSWSIDLNADREIMVVVVKLLTSLDDLLSFSHI